MNLPAMKTLNVRQTVTRSIAVLAACAAIASFSHIYSFARAAGQPVVIALLYPGSIDVLVECAIACLLHASRNKQLNPAFPRWAFGIGVAATVAANIGDHFRPIPFPVGATVSGWPAVSFVLAVMLGHWYWNSGTAENLRKEGISAGNLPLPPGTPSGRFPADAARAGRFPVPEGEEAASLPDVAAAVTVQALDDTESYEEPVQGHGTGRFPLRTGTPTGRFPAGRGDGRKSSGPEGAAPQLSKTERVLDALQKARAAGENPTAAALAQECAVSPTLARNVVRDSKVSSNGASSNGHTP